MPRFAANLSMMFTEVAFLERFGAAARAGFAAVEFLFPYEVAPQDIAAQLRDHDLQQALFNAPPGDFAKGERGIASLAGRESEFDRGFDQALLYADRLNCRTIHVMAGLAADKDRDQAFERYVASLTRVAARAASAGVMIVLEPINTRDMPGYLINRSAEARQAIAAVGAKNIRLQLDLYHRQIMEGDLTRAILDNSDITGHVQIAGPPDRHEPDSGEVRFDPLFALLDQQGYAGYVGCEYRPRGRTEEGLSWFAPYRRQISSR